MCNFFFSYETTVGWLASQIVNPCQAALLFTHSP